MIHIKTKRLILRSVCAMDAETIHDYRNHPACARYQRGQTQDLDGIRMMIEERKTEDLTTEKFFMLAMTLAQTGEMIGEIVVMPNDGAITLGYTVSYRHHRKGYAFEALEALIELLHARFPSFEFIAFTDPENIASKNLLLKLGYSFITYAAKIESDVFGKYLTEGEDPL